jgi:hypothetical protein
VWCGLWAGCAQQADPAGSKGENHQHTLKSQPVTQCVQALVLAPCSGRGGITKSTWSKGISMTGLGQHFCKGGHPKVS